MKPIVADAAAISEAALLLRQGRLVAFPTETVYGLGADASNDGAVRRIFSAKGRPADHPLIVHIPAVEALADWAQAVPESASRLAAEFWPGPLTLVLKKKPKVSAVVTGGQDTIALRMPDNPVALRLLQAFGGGIAAPSANRFKHISPTRAAHVAAELGACVAMILDGGPCQIGLESTIIDLSGAQPMLLRPGQISRTQIERVLGIDVTVISLSEVAHADNSRAPGMMAVHYAPVTKALLCASEQLPDKVLAETCKNRKVGVLAYRQILAQTPSCHVIPMPAAAKDYAQVLYAALRELDAMQLNCILVEQPPDSEDWRAINDRLSKATQRFQ
ncbi:MAG: threonylcarbamoyl-AMP synthase [Gammaproteobacteria bacterium HGW-Gammaproteobacteria-3]|nr:MAG: threonylcarbamoyl-AMP synthase [Gammaproteobacteria bacterium HGW-Gammaproteobacteria-3]